MDIIRGAFDKPVSTNRLLQAIEATSITNGVFYTGYPIIGSVEGKNSLDAMLITPRYGIVIFDVVEEPNVRDHSEIRDALFNAMISRLIKVKGLSLKRGVLDVDLNVFTFAPSWNRASVQDKDVLVTESELFSALSSIDDEKNEKIYIKTLEAIQAITRLKQRPPRSITSVNTKGYFLNQIEKSISNLDRFQSKAVIETSLGIQRIRGLAGSGKTVVLALKAAYLHSKNPDWKIGITFYTRSLKNQFKEFVSKFTIEQKGEEPDWDKVRIIQAWGSPSVDGFYYSFCKLNDIEYFNYDEAKAKFGLNVDFLGLLCEEALKKVATPKPDYDVILIDEAQDFSESFLKICFNMLKPSDINNSNNRRLIYAYDELQKLNDITTLRSPKEIFGDQIDFENDPKKPLQDIMLPICYRNNAPVLVSAHGLGFGIYRQSDVEPHFVTMFQNKSLWEDVGYKKVGGTLELGEYVELARDEETSPDFLSTFVPKSELVLFQAFRSTNEQNEWIANQIVDNLTKDDLGYNDIIVIHPNVYTTKSETAKLRGALINKGINSHLTGVSTSPDDFFVEKSIAFTSIYRAKGNEAAMIYIMNSHYCYDGGELIKKRNILFTAITRSKGWVRACGVGERMEGLINEFNKIVSNRFTLKFIYPTLEQMDHLNVIHRERSEKEKKKIQKSDDILKLLLRQLESKEINLEDLSKAEVERLKKYLNDIK